MLGKRFRIVRLLGAGKLSTVFLAEQTAVGNRPVALKIVLRKLIGHPDMLGNVQEWVNDWYGENYYSASPQRDPQGPEGGKHRVPRGGCWGHFPWFVRVSNRNRIDGWESTGFRCVREAGSR
jgi:formylglycine-generating enzyme required for sulfatase activity